MQHKDPTERRVTPKMPITPGRLSFVPVGLARWLQRVKGASLAELPVVSIPSARPRF
jgi:hypothetical protein